jgi:uncharacterized protein
MLIAVLSLLGLLWATITIALMALGILCPPRMTDGKAVYRLHRLSPGDLGLGFENQNFTVRDERTGWPLHIAGWWIPHTNASGRCVVLLHGYADAKVGAIAWAPMLHHLEFNILAIDLRAHGESGGTFSTGGYFERDDLSQVIDQLRIERPGDTRQLILFGLSLGAVVAAATAARRDDIDAVVMESPFTEYRRVISAHAELIGMPTGPLLRVALWTAQTISGAKFVDVQPVDAIAKMKCPAMVILAQKDDLLDASDIEAFRAANPARLLVAEDAAHLMAWHTDSREYEAVLRGFLSQSISPPLCGGEIAQSATTQVDSDRASHPRGAGG